MTKKKKITLLLVLDVAAVSLVYILALLLRFEFAPSNPQYQGYIAICLDSLVWLALIKIAVFASMGLYSSLWKYASMDELVRIAAASFVGNAFAVVFMMISGHTLPRSVYLMAVVLDMAAIGLIRLSYRWARNRYSYRQAGRIMTGGLLSYIKSRNTSYSKRMMVVGAGDAGAALIKEVRLHPDQRQQVVVAVDDDKEKLNQRIYGVRIAGNRSDIPRLAQKYDVDEIVITMPSVSRARIREILEECNRTQCKVKILPAYIDLINEKVSIKALRDVEIEDLLGRDPVQVDMEEISGYLEGKIVLVTGGAGSIGSELCRQIGRYRPHLLICVDVNENAIHEFSAEFRARYPEVDYTAVLASVRDVARMREIFKKHRPHVVFHAAAHKHVPLMETNPREAIINNALGTKIVMDAAEEYRTEKLVMISTDKAVNPTNVMGATKRIGEMLIQERSRTSETSFAAVRFGNVLGSNGSVIPTFRRQIAAGGPVTVTHKDICRYFMTIPEAVQLVIQAGAMAEGGEIFVLDMGEPVKILELAEKLIRLSGFEPYEDIRIEITGLRPGEKLYEELLLSEEGLQDTAHHKIFVGHPTPASPALLELLSAPGKLEAAIREVSELPDRQMRTWLRKIVPNYSTTPNGHYEL
jgi:FlaA1/EpsC-like NDP-sugar epimerase